MPLSEAFATRKMCIGPPKQGHLEKRKEKSMKVDFALVLKANPYRIGRGGPHAGEFTSKARAGAPTTFDPKDAMRVANMVKAGPKALSQAATMAKSITTWEKAHRRANAAEAAGQSEMAKIFRSRADALKSPTVSATVSSTAKPAVQAVTVTPKEAAKTTGVGGMEQWHAAAAQALAGTPKVVATPAVTTPAVAAVTVTPKEQAKTQGYTPAYDKEGFITGKSAPDHKDSQRIEDMAKASMGPDGLNKAKMNAKATAMAKSITNADKAYRRGMAAEFENYHSAAKIFYDRANELAGGTKNVTVTGAPVAAAKPTAASVMMGVQKELNKTGGTLSPEHAKAIVDVFDGPLQPIIAPKPAAPKTHKSYVIGVKEPVNTAAPESHWLLQEDPKLTLMRAEAPGSKPILVSGGSSAKPGDVLEMLDDGNLTSRFGTKTPSKYTVTHTASSHGELKSFPKAKLKLYVLK